jgi:hypothetical protein
LKKTTDFTKKAPDDSIIWGFFVEFVCPKISYTQRVYFMNTEVIAVKKRTQRDYTLGFKLAVVSGVEKGYITYKQAQKVMASNTVH